MDVLLSRIVKLLAFILVSSTLLVPQAAFAFKVGCPWYETYQYSSPTLNKGDPDANADYWTAFMESKPDPESQIVIHGQFPQARYFSIVAAVGTGVTLDHLFDSDLVPDEGGSPSSTLSTIPGWAALGYHYTITVKFMSPPAVREPNTLYIPPGSTNIYKLVLRIYLPDVGQDVTGGVGLPTLTYEGPKGTIDLNESPELKSCKNFFNLVWGNRTPVNISFVSPPATPKFLLNSSTSFLTQNPDAGIVLSKTSNQYDDLVVIRTKAPITPDIDPIAPQARYWSFCQYGLHSTAVIGCFADRDAIAQDDGYFNFVVSPADLRPALANADNGYNWLPWGDEEDGYILIRQILANADFAGNYATAGVGKFYPNAKILGDWAPTITYCDAATFDANAAAGGAEVFSACQAAYKSK